MAIVRTIRLLVVEDDPAYRYLIKHAFAHREKQIRWALTVAVNGEEALHFLFEEEDQNVPLPELILLDWNLPRVTGGEVLRRLKQHEKLRKIPVLVFSASDADRDILTAYDNHANGYIRKTWESDALTAIVETIERFCVAATLPKVMR